MKKPYLEVTYRKGRPIAAYLYLPRNEGDRSERTEKADGGLVVDFTAGGKPIGIEITSPSTFDPGSIDRLLESLGFDRVDHQELLPLTAA